MSELQESFWDFETIKKSVESPGTEIPSELRHASIEEFTKWMTESINSGDIIFRRA